jgi:malectin (di-glucose binding ER protein)/Big-like domain-containing protein
MNNNQTKDGAFDGGYAFADMCPPAANGSSTYPCADSARVPLVAGTYITHVLMPKNSSNQTLYHIVREEDVNVDLGDQFEPQIPPPPCTGDMHTVSIDPAVMPRGSPYNGQSMPLCDKKLIVLQNKQNANADFFVMTNFKNGDDVQPPGRLIGLVTDDVYFDRDIQSIWYGEARAVGNMPIGIRDYAGRLLTTIKTDLNGAFEVLLPSTQTFNCPIPQGPCPGMYMVIVNDPGDPSAPNGNYNPNYRTEQLAWDVWPGNTTQLDIPAIPVSGTKCLLTEGTPELLQVSKPHVSGADTGTARQITISGDFFGTSAGRVTLDDTLARQGQSTRNLTVGNGGIVTWENRRIVIQVPVASDTFLPGPKQLLIKGSNGLRSPNGITVHVRGTVGTTTYNPTIVNVAAPTSNAHALQNAIDGAAAGSLVVLSAGIYRENVIVSKPLKLQGLGPGGVVGTTETLNTPPDDPRFNILGTTIDGRFFADGRAYWIGKLNALKAATAFDGNQAVSEGADITVLAKNGAFGSGLGAAAIDGLSVTTGQGSFGAGGLQANAYVRNLRVTNNVFEGDHGLIGGAINLGSPYTGNQHNENASIRYTRVLGSGGVTRGGAISIFNGADNYDIADNILCSNFSNEYGAGISHWGLSPGGKIHDNQIFNNNAVDSGAGISISSETPQPITPTNALGPGSGAVDIDRNLIQSNLSGDDGGGIYVVNARSARINIRNNMIANNVAADMGGAVMLENAANVAIVNNTIAKNATTATYEGTDGQPHSAGLASHKNHPQHQATLPPGAKDFSNPVALFNNIFWENEAFTLDRNQAPPALVSQGFIDFEVFGSADPNAAFDPRNSLLTSAYGQPNAGNVIGQDPLFVDPVTLKLVVGMAEGDPQFASVELVPPLKGLQGNYHLQAGSPAVDIGVSTNNGIAAPTVDVDLDGRPQGSRWDAGADEVSFVTISPAGGATGVSTNAVVTVTFLAPIDPATFTTSSAQLIKDGGAVVTTSPSYNSATRTATITPVLPLDASTEYTVRLDTTIKTPTGAQVFATPFVSTFTTTSVRPTVRINAGGPAYKTFLADSYFRLGSVRSVTSTISNTADPALYQNERYGGFVYNIPVSNGLYDVKFYFAETLVFAAGARIFSLDILDTAAPNDISDLDIYASAPGRNRAYTRTVTGVTVADSTLGIRAVPNVGDPTVAAIEVIPR